MQTKSLILILSIALLLGSFYSLTAKALTINDYVVQTNIMNGSSGWFNTAENQIQLWWDGTYVVLRGPLTIHNVLYEYPAGQWQNRITAEDTTITLKTSSDTLRFDIYDTFSTSWQIITDRTRVLSLSTYSTTQTSTQTTQKPKLGAFLGSNAITASQVQTALASWKTKTGKGLAYVASVSIFGYPNSPVGIWQIDSYKTLVQQGLIEGVAHSWMPSYNYDSSTGQQCIYDIANGKYDTFLHTEAQRSRNAGYPIIIRFGYEFNGFWNGWGNNPADFKQAWIRIVDIFRQEGATNVKFFWCANYNNNPSSRSFTYYYPGDYYVDYVGVDLYADSQYYTWGTAERKLSDPSCNVYGTYTNKPFIIGEWGLTNALTDTQNAQWLSGLFDAVDARPRITAMFHWMETWNGASVDLYPTALQVYKTRTVSYLPL